MSRAEIALGDDTSAVHLERCCSCLGVWFDAGEWSILADKHLLEHFNELWSAEWRRTQRQTLEYDECQRRLEEKLGPDLLAQIRVLAAVLRDHPRRSQALAVPREEMSGETNG